MATKAKSKSVVVNSDKPIGKKKPLVGIVDRLFKVAVPLVNAHNASDTANDAVSACRKSYFSECIQALGKGFYTKEKKHLALQAKKAFYMAHYESKGMKVLVEINASRGELKLESADGQDAKVKAENANAGTRWNKFVDWCKDEDAGKHKEKDPNNRQTKSGNKRTLADIVKDNGQRLYNAFYKAGKLEDCQAIKAICARYKHTCTVPSGAKK
jgi:hypothetical protein